MLAHTAGRQGRPLVMGDGHGGDLFPFCTVDTRHFAVQRKGDGGQVVVRVFVGQVCPHFFALVGHGALDGVDKGVAGAQQPGMAGLYFPGPYGGALQDAFAFIPRKDALHGHAVVLVAKDLRAGFILPGRIAGGQVVKIFGRDKGLHLGIIFDLVAVIVVLGQVVDVALPESCQFDALLLLIFPPVVEDGGLGLFDDVAVFILFMHGAVDV